MRKFTQACNIQNASFGATICAERCATFKAVSDGCTKIDKIVIVCSTHDFAYPCGICRQVMTEFMDENGIIVVTNDKEIREYKLSDSETAGKFSYVIRRFQCQRKK